MTMFSALWFGFVCVWILLIFAISVSAWDPSKLSRINGKILMLPAVGLVLVLFSAPFWIIGFRLVKLIIKSSFIHENLTITPWNFRIERTVEFRQRRSDSASKVTEPETQLTHVDRMSCNQLEGATSDLVAATVKPILIVMI